MGRPTLLKQGNTIGNFFIKQILPNGSAGKHKRAIILCLVCQNEKEMSSQHIKIKTTCGCKQRESKYWKSIGPKTMPWQLPYGVAAKNALFYGYRKQADRRGIEFTLTEDEFFDIITQDCHYCGIHLPAIQKTRGKSSGSFSYTGLDRVDNSKPYTKDNVTACCWKCNQMKHSNSYEEFLTHITKIYNHLQKNETNNP